MSKVCIKTIFKFFGRSKVELDKWKDKSFLDGITQCHKNVNDLQVSKFNIITIKF